ncbi:MAG: hypothetical protein JO319_18725 [Acidobacteriaceae bacterium]|nr:hypothetical protein [Acidobacteriaceae bacterium]
MPDTEQLHTLSAELLANAELSEGAQKLFRSDLTPAAYLAGLSNAGLFPDAVKFTAQVLGAKKSVAWAAACVRELGAENGQTEQQKAALAAAQQWLTEANDEARRAAQKAAELAKISTPEGCVAIAAFFSEGSIAPPHVQSVPPPPNVAAKIAAGGILLAVIKEPKMAVERFERCLQLGLKEIPA